MFFHRAMPGVTQDVQSKDLGFGCPGMRSSIIPGNPLRSISSKSSADDPLPNIYSFCSTPICVGGMSPLRNPSLEGRLSPKTTPKNDRSK